MSTPSVHQGRPKDLNLVGTVPAATLANGVTVLECGMDGPMRTTVFKFTNMLVTITDTATPFGSVQLYDFPTGIIKIHGASIRFTPTTTTAIATTLNSGVTCNWGVGTVTAAALDLGTTTQQNVIPGTSETDKTFTSSTTINVAAAAATGFLAAVSAAQIGVSALDGTATPIDLWFNITVPTNTDIDADATVAINGYLIVQWQLIGITALTALSE